MMILARSALRTVPSRQPTRRPPVLHTARSTSTSSGAVGPSDAVAAESLLLQRARMLYGPAWSEGKVDLLDTIMDEDHEQCDVIWQPGNVGRGRRLMQRGIATFRLSYPDLRFEVLAASCCESAVLVHWEASGTNTGPMKDRPATGDPVRFSGMSKLNFNSDGMIKRSEVYRVAPEHERLYFQSRMAKSAAEKPE